MKESSDRTLFMKDDFTTLKNDRVLIKQTKNQSTYIFAGQKLTTLFSIHFWLKLF